MDELGALVDDATNARLAQGPRPRTLRVASLEPGDVGLLNVEVRSVGAVRSFTSKAGREGTLRRVTLGDPSGEVDIVLWGDETNLAVDGPLVPGAHVVLRGATVKAGFQGGVELGLGGAIMESVETPEESFRLEGVLESLSDSQISGTPPNVRFHAEAALVTSEGRIQVLLWDDCIKAARGVLPGATLRIDGATLHPTLEGWFVADGAAVTHR